MAEASRITQIAEREAELFLAEEASQFLDCAIRLMASRTSISSVIKRLKDEIEMLEEFG